MERTLFPNVTFPQPSYLATLMSLPYCIHTIPGQYLESTKAAGVTVILPGRHFLSLDLGRSHNIKIQLKVIFLPQRSFCPTPYLCYVWWLLRCQIIIYKECHFAICDMGRWIDTLRWTWRRRSVVEPERVAFIDFLLPPLSLFTPRSLPP